MPAVASWCPAVKNADLHGLQYHSMTGVMTEIVAKSSLGNHPRAASSTCWQRTPGRIAEIAAAVPAKQSDRRQTAGEIRRSPFAIHQQSARHIRAVPLIERPKSRVTNSPAATILSLALPWAAPHASRWRQWCQKRLFLRLLAHKPLQFSGYLALAHPRLIKRRICSAPRSAIPQARRIFPPPLAF